MFGWRLWIQTRTVHSPMHSMRSMVMVITTHSARIIGPMVYGESSGSSGKVPLGSCTVRQIDGHLVDIIWRTHGKSHAKMCVEAIEAAQDSGSLVLLD